MLQFEDFEIPTDKFVSTYLRIAASGLKRRLKDKSLSKNLSVLLSEKTISIRVLAKFIDDLRKKNMNNNENTALLNITIFDLIQRFGTVLIPYTDVAEMYLGWTKKTAMAKIGLANEMGLNTIKFYESNKAPVFVFAQDLAEYFIKTRAVHVSR